jgi:hypothetical protein
MATYWSNIPALDDDDDDDCGIIDEMALTGETEVLVENLSNRRLVHHTLLILLCM